MRQTLGWGDDWGGEVWRRGSGGTQDLTGEMGFGGVRDGKKLGPQPKGIAGNKSVRNDLLGSGLNPPHLPLSPLSDFSAGGRGVSAPDKGGTGGKSRGIGVPCPSHLSLPGSLRPFPCPILSPG